MFNSRWPGFMSLFQKCQLRLQLAIWDMLSFSSPGPGRSSWQVFPCEHGSWRKSSVTWKRGRFCFHGKCCAPTLQSWAFLFSSLHPICSCSKWKNLVCLISFYYVIYFKIPGYHIPGTYLSLHALVEDLGKIKYQERSICHIFFLMTAARSFLDHNRFSESKHLVSVY